MKCEPLLPRSGRQFYSGWFNPERKRHYNAHMSSAIISINHLNFIRL